MAETREHPAAGSEMTERFIEFILFQTQNASMFLGLMPNPQTGKTEVNLQIARMLIDQLEMIEKKTAGNLNAEELQILNNALTNLRIAFVEASASGGRTTLVTESANSASSAAGTSSQTPQAAPPPPSAEEPEAGSRKKFTKSYGA